MRGPFACVVILLATTCGGSAEYDPAHTCPRDADLTLSPRADKEAEEIAFRSARTVAASTEVYERVRADLATIRRAFPEVAKLSVRLLSVPLLVYFDAGTWPQVAAGRYSAWDCLNSRYGAAVLEKDGGAVHLGFPGRVNAMKLVELYRSLPGV